MNDTSLPISQQLAHVASVLQQQRTGVTTMNWDQIKCNWIQVCDKIKVTWGKLSEDDLAAIAGLLQERYGYAKV